MSKKQNNLNGATVYFIYDAKNCMPNGNPDNGEQRYDEVKQKAIVSSFRFKRFGRDSIIEYYPNQSFYEYDKDYVQKYGQKAKKGKKNNEKEDSGATSRFNAFINEKGKVLKDELKNNGAEDVILKYFMDARIYGSILTSKENKAHITGAFQIFDRIESENVVEYEKNFVNMGITSHFPTNHTKGQGSMGNKNFIKYGIFNAHGRFCAQQAKLNKIKSMRELDMMLLHTWDRIEHINTGSKLGHKPIAIIIVNHKTKEKVVENEDGKDIVLSNSYLGRDFKPFQIKLKDESKDTSDIFDREDYNFDFSNLVNRIEKDKKIESVKIYTTDYEMENSFNSEKFEKLRKTDSNKNGKIEVELLNDGDVKEKILDYEDLMEVQTD